MKETICEECKKEIVAGESLHLMSEVMFFDNDVDNDVDDDLEVTFMCEACHNKIFGRDEK